MEVLVDAFLSNHGQCCHTGLGAWWPNRPGWTAYRVCGPLFPRRDQTASFVAYAESLLPGEGAVVGKLLQNTRQPPEMGGCLETSVSETLNSPRGNPIPVLLQGCLRTKPPPSIRAR